MGEGELDKKRLSIFIFIVLMVIIGFFIFQKETWQGVYYPNGCLVCEDEYIYSPVYETKEDCLNWARNKYNERQNSSDDFECGKNCKQQEGGFMVCDETVDA